METPGSERPGLPVEPADGRRDPGARDSARPRAVSEIRRSRGTLRYSSRRSVGWNEPRRLASGPVYPPPDPGDRRSARGYRSGTRFPGTSLLETVTDTRSSPTGCTRGEGVGGRFPRSSIRARTPGNATHSVRGFRDRNARKGRSQRPDGVRSATNCPHWSAPGTRSPPRRHRRVAHRPSQGSMTSFPRKLSSMTARWASAASSRS
jgi:hypothetical protein